MDRLLDAPLGWKRYQSAGIEVRDMLEDRTITPTEMETRTIPFEEAMYNARFCGDGEVDLELEKMDRGKQV
jgi:hypothetical protein